MGSERVRRGVLDGSEDVLHHDPILAFGHIDDKSGADTFRRFDQARLKQSGIVDDGGLTYAFCGKHQNKGSHKQSRSVIHRLSLRTAIARR
jgi:hypothetical protein